MLRLLWWVLCKRASMTTRALLLNGNFGRRLAVRLSGCFPWGFLWNFPGIVSWSVAGDVPRCFSRCLSVNFSGHFSGYLSVRRALRHGNWSRSR